MKSRLLVAVAGLGMLLLGVTAAVATSPPPGGTAPAFDRRAVAAQVLASHRGAMLTGPARLAISAMARGDGSLRHPMTTSQVSPRQPAGAAHPAGDVSDLAQESPSSAQAPANVRVNAREEDVHQVSQTTQSETSIAVTGAHVVVGFNDSQTALYQLVPGDDLAGYSFSDNGGSSFTDGGQLPNRNAFVNIGDPALAAAGGQVYYSNLAIDLTNGNLEVVVAPSSDNGHTWSQPVVSSTHDPAAWFYIADKDALVAGSLPAAGGPVLYDAFSDFEVTGSGKGKGAPTGGGSPPPPPPPTPSGGPPVISQLSGLAVSRSLDGGKTWELHYADQHAVGGGKGGGTGCSVTDYSGAAPVVDVSTGTLYVAAERFAVDDPSCQFKAQPVYSEVLFTSTDGGVSFGPPVTIGTVVTVPPVISLGPGSGMRAVEFPSLALVGTDLYVAWNDAGLPDGRSHVRLARSTNGGTSWTLRNLGSSGGQDLQPALSGDVTGLHLANYRVHPDLTLDVVSRDSTDGGAHFTSRRLSSVSFPGVPNNPQFDPLIAPAYMGDYIANVSDGTHRYFAWGDNRDVVTDFLFPQGRHDPDVFFAGT